MLIDLSDKNQTQRIAKINQVFRKCSRPETIIEKLKAIYYYEIKDEYEPLKTQFLQEDYKIDNKDNEISDRTRFQFDNQGRKIRKFCFYEFQPYYFWRLNAVDEFDSSSGDLIKRFLFDYQTGFLKEEIVYHPGIKSCYFDTKKIDYVKKYDLRTGNLFQQEFYVYNTSVINRRLQFDVHTGIKVFEVVFYANYEKYLRTHFYDSIHYFNICDSHTGKLVFFCKQYPDGVIFEMRDFLKNFYCSYKFDDYEERYVYYSSFPKDYIFPNDFNLLFQYKWYPAKKYKFYCGAKYAKGFDSKYAYKELFIGSFIMKFDKIRL